MTKRSIFLTSLILSCVLIAFAGPVDGRWTASNTPPQGEPQVLTLQANGAVLTGTADGIQITNGKVQGTTIWFNVVRSGVTYSYKGTVSATRMDLSETRADGSNHRPLIFNHN